MDKELQFSDAYPPREISRKVESLGVAKARTDALTLLKLAVLAGVRAYPARVKCATLAWHSLEAALENKETTVTTE